MWLLIIKALEISIAVGTLSLTLTKGSIFREVRLKIKQKSIFFGKLFSCPYCMSHWIATITVLIFNLRLFSAPWLIDILFSVLVVIGISALFFGVIMALISFSSDEEDPYEFIERLTETIVELKTENEELKNTPF